MRDIVFRGKRLDNGEWVTGSLLLQADKGACWIVNSLWLGTLRVNGYVVNPVTVGQYIGVVDKDDKRIFEGDIVKVTYGGEGKGLEGVGEVAFENGKFGILWGHRKELVAFDGFHRSIFEVIGNTHDNKQQ